jgi:AAA family ATP:ADP antiporter
MARTMAGNPLTKFRTFLFDTVLSVERHEYVAVAWSFAYFFCVLSSYYILRPIREAMAVGSGAHTIPYLFTATFAVMMLVTPVFGWVASRFPRRKFLPGVYLFFVCNILIFWVVFSDRIDDGQDHIWLGRAFFVWLSIFNLFVVSVFWSFMADIYTREQGRRLFGIIASGGSIGALIGGIATSAIVVRIGFQNLFPLAAALLLFAIVCISRLRKWTFRERQDDVAESVNSEAALGGSSFSGITQVFKSRYFSAIATASIIASLLGNALYMFTLQLVGIEIAGADERTQFFSNLNIAANAISFIVQAVIVKRVVGRFGIGVSLSVLPILSIAGFALLAVDPVLAVVAMLTLLRRGLGFGFSKPTTNMLYSVVTPEEKYKTKNFIDTAVFRFGDAAGSWAILFMMGLGITGISIVMVPFSVIWAGIALWLGRAYRRQARQLRDSGVT